VKTLSLEFGLLAVDNEAETPRVSGVISQIEDNFVRGNPTLQNQMFFVANTEGGVVQLVKALANEWAPRSINVNAMAPGCMATDNTAELRKHPERSRQILERALVGQWDELSELVGAAVSLCPPASDHVHGHVLVVDGGWLVEVDPWH